MQAFFNGCRRTAGCALLVVACALMEMWLRSYSTIDVVNFPIGRQRAILFFSVDDSIVCRIGWNSDDPWEEFAWRTFPTANYQSRDLDDLQSDCRFDRPLHPLGQGDMVDWNLIYCGLGLGQTAAMDWHYCQQYYFVVPYWSIVIPLTLLTTYLIFWQSPKQVHRLVEAKASPQAVGVP